MSKKIYLIRHGEGVHNVNRIYSSPEFELTELGKKQAESARERVESLPIDLIISSPYKRTVQTTEIINKNMQLEVVISDLAKEVIRPSEIAGKSMDDPKIREIRKKLDENFHLSDWHYSDEENFYDLRKRAFDFINYLESRSGKSRILVITHSVFIKMLVLSMLLEEELSPQVFLKAFYTMHLETSGITICEKKDGKWGLITWNDHAHLAESSSSLE